MAFTEGDRVTIGPVSIFRSATMSDGDRVRGNDVIQRGCPALSVGDRVIVDPIGIRKSMCNEHAWLSDAYNNSIIKCSLSDFSVLSELGTTGSGNNNFDEPMGICRDNTYLYICDNNNNRVKKHRADDLSYISEVAVSDARGITTDGTYLYICSKYVLYKYNKSDLSLVTQIGSYGSGNNQFDELWYLTTDGTYLYCMDRLNNNRIVKRNCSDLAYVSKVSYSGGLDITWTGSSMVITNTASDCLSQYNSSLTLIQDYGSLGTGDAEFNNPWAITAGNNRVYLYDSGNHRIKVHSSNLSYLADYTMTSRTIEGMTI